MLPSVWAHTQPLFSAINPVISWTRPTNISRTNIFGFTSETGGALALDPDGNLHVAFHGFSRGGPYVEYDVFYVNNISGSWSVPHNVTWNGILDSFATVAVDYKGNIHIAYARFDPFDMEIFYVNKTAGGWSIPENVSKNDKEDTLVAIEVDSQGYAHMVWEGGHEIFYANNIGGSWSLPLNISQSRLGDDYPSLALDSQDNVHIVWEGRDDSATGDREIFYANNIKGEWVKENVTKNDLFDIKPAMALDSEDNVHISYIQLDTASYEFGVFYAGRINEDWGTPAEISLSKEVSYSTSLAVDGAGKIHVIFCQLEGIGFDNEILYTNNRLGDWQEPTNLTQNSWNDNRPNIVINDWNYAHIVYYVSGFNNILYIRSTEPVVSLATQGFPVMLMLIAGTLVVMVASVAIWLLRRREVPFP
ncbi:MAG: hypothetical protein ACFE7E_04025 [Candidatus Hodarchaeota archaeon]